MRGEAVVERGGDYYRDPSVRHDPSVCYRGDKAPFRMPIIMHAHTFITACVSYLTQQERGESVKI